MGEGQIIVLVNGLLTSCRKQISLSLSLSDLGTFVILQAKSIRYMTDFGCELSG